MRVLRAVIYCRTSSLGQRDRHTIESQITTLPEFVRSRGWQLVRPARHYVDDGFTAKAGHLDDREALKRLLRDAAAGEFEIVAVVDGDRLTRAEDLVERGAILGAFQRAGVQVAIASKGQVLDLNTDEGDLLASLDGYFSASWLRKHKERIKRGKDRAIAEKRKPAGPTPFGLAYDRETGTWSTDKDRAAIVREIYERVAAGTSCAALAIDFNVRNVPRAVRREKPTKDGAAPAAARPWSRERIWNLVTSRTYLGEWTADKRRKLVVPVPRIISDELWHAAQAALMKHKLRGLKRTKHVYLLEEIGRCAVCGEPIVISSASRNARRVAYYLCRSRRLATERGQRGQHCGLPMLRVDDTDRRVWAAISDLLERPDHLDRALAKRGTDADRGEHDWEGDLRGYDAKLKNSHAAEAVFLERFERGLVSEKALDATLKRMAAERGLLETQLATARAQLAGARREQADVAAVKATIETLRVRLADATPEVKRDLVRALVPGRGEHVARLAAKEIELSVVVAATAADSVESAPAPVALRLVA